MTPGRGPSQFPQAIAPFQTPSRSPGRSQRSPRSNRKWQAELMPPPPPPAFVDPNRFKTPGRAGTSQRKGKDRLDLKPAASPSFSNLQDSFHVDPNVELDRLNKRAKQTHVGSALSPFDEDDRRGDAKSSPPYDGGFALDIEPTSYPPAQTDEPEQFQIERSDADLRGEVGRRFVGVTWRHCAELVLYRSFMCYSSTLTCPRTANLDDLTLRRFNGSSTSRPRTYCRISSRTHTTPPVLVFGMR